MRRLAVDWNWWWKQVEKGLIPECAYRMAKIRAEYVAKIRDLRK